MEQDFTHSTEIGNLAPVIAGDYGMTRKSLEEKLDGLHKADFDRLVAHLGASGYVTEDGPPKERVNELLEWAESTGRLGLAKVDQEVEKIIRSPVATTRLKIIGAQLDGVFQYLRQILKKLWSSRHVKIAIIPVLLVTLVGIKGIHFLRATPQEQEQMLITWGFWPKPYTENWWDEFDVDKDQKLADACSPVGASISAWMKNGRWDYPKESWRIVRGSGSSDQDGALLMSGDDLGTPDNLGSKAFYDFEVEFTIRFCQGTKASWAFRLQPDKQRGYFFELERSGSVSSLKSYVCRQPGQRKSLGDQKINSVIKDDDTIWIKAQIINDAFHYCLKIMPHDILDERPIGELRNDFRDENNYFSYGNVGLFTDQNSSIQINYWRVTPMMIDAGPFECGESDPS
jgi:hypothetical protein